MLKLADQQKRQLTHKIQERQSVFEKKLLEVQKNAEATAKALKQKALEYEKQAIFFKKEKEYMEEKTQELTQANDKIRFEMNSLREDYEAEVTELETRVRTYKASFVSPKDMELRFQAQKSSMETRLLQKDEKIRELEVSIQNLQTQQAQITKLAQKRLKDLQTLQQQNAFRVSRDEIEGIKNELYQTRKDNDELQEKLMKTKAEKNSLLTNATNLKTENQGLRSHNYDLTEILEKKKREIKNKEKEIIKIKSQYSQLLSDHHKSRGDGMTSEERIKSLILQVQR